MTTNKTETRILLVDDDEELTSLLKRFFTKNGFVLFTLPSAENLHNHMQHYHPDIIILDVMLPGIDGIEALKRTRQRHFHIPIILLSAKNEAIDKILGLEAGADDYVGKPFVAHELLARVRAVLRRNTSNHPSVGSVIQFGDLSVDLENKVLLRGDEVQRLSNVEFSTLEILANNLNDVVSRNQLIYGVYGALSDVSERTSDVLIWRIRQMIETEPSRPTYLKTIRGVGYMLSGEVKEASL